MSNQDLFNMVKALMQDDQQKAAEALSAHLDQQGKAVLPRIIADESDDQ